MKKKISLISTTLFVPTVSFAVDMIDYSNQKPTGIIDKFTTFIVGFAGALALLFIIYGGLQLVTSNGNKERMEGAKKTLTYAIFGLIIVILSYFIVSILINLPSEAGITQ